ncbi:PaaJ Acetyl-CoA acetyltransferase [Candidatus Nanopelagicaceae bacterium]|jgi:acetyl-CoA acyltransferase|uniref:Acetyl-CoA acyltransferase n=1 Tax=Candidatus Planktophila lacus TaxID=1884913 RepID=A0AAC9YRJ5_9ACTN|nr:thiolase family protein [Candidatus Planktophila lacus]ASY10737.1 acetyl-CoA acyltransferase [Candidatus Planktophila lacus]ASY25193.1 acetyl-CoA acyltransferase [Candidatus Planktophila lacus]ASY29155.1 acetyl-CoA acyltransferase [Candidatus Planktophila lacus]
MSRTVVLVDAVRTPFGKAGSMYSGTRADDLMVRAMRGLLERNPKVSPDAIEDVAIAAATQTGDQGMNLGRSASLLAGLPVTVPGYSVDRWCAGAMTSMTTLAGAIAIGSIDIAIAGGVEHMGNHPIGDGLDPNPRFLAERIVEQDALAMGATAERLHDRFPQLTKERADRYAYNSQMKTAAAYAAGKIQRDLIPTAARIPEMGWGIATVDEPPRPTTTMEGLATLKTPFRAAGRVTPGNSSGLNDGATAALLASEDKAKELGLTIKAKLVSYAFAGVEPEVMGFGPVPSTIKALAKAGLKIEDIGAFEVNEAFAVQVIAFLDHFGIADDDPRVNPYGGAIAVGHPLASSGIRLALNLARAFEEHPEVRYGLTTMCIGLGMGGTVIWENPHFSGGSK